MLRQSLKPRETASLPGRLLVGSDPMDIDAPSSHEMTLAPSLSRLARPHNPRKDRLNARDAEMQALKEKVESLALHAMKDPEDVSLEAKVSYRKRVTSEPSLAFCARESAKMRRDRAHEKVQHWRKELGAPLPVREEPEGPAVDLTPEFTEEEEDLYDEAMHNSNEDKILVQKFNVDLFAKQLWCLKGLEWLNDEVINFYLSLLRVRSLELIESGSKPALACYFHLSLFYTKLTENGQYDYSRVKRWTKRGFRKCDLFTQDVVFFPRNIGNSHWTLCAAFVKEKRIEYFDSLAGSGRNCMTHVLRYLVDEFKDKHGGELDTTDWELIDHGDAVPQQNNGSDCGVFLCTFCNYLSMAHELDFSAADMPYMRKRIAVDIIKAASTFVIPSSSDGAQQ
ncbi:Sentrin-specific protease [Hondaea fermentalgiana]|uniref:Sentrin-specific protease n=1 Tax=Hondaea fermentalgiana TaxID=2315210 RepID=A0A2R5GBI8_9STRA|nr:Sentrin-specific protease [Hondaea fermentalgiana]|eukprot:GBG27945.1 Sentrin-specific protease [Hondaea fermentalgiana]